MKPIAVAKLHPRLTSPRPVPRTALIDTMHAAAPASLVLVHGPAGFGKTTAMLQYFTRLRDRGVAVGWLTLDRLDNDLSRLLRYLGEALRPIDEGLAAVLAGQARIDAGDADVDVDVDPGTGSVPGPGTLLDVTARLSSITRPFALFLDDFEFLESPAALALVRQVIDYLPACGHLVIASRTVPDIGLGRLRAHGRLIEISTALLRFTAAETATFLRQQRGLALRDEDIGRLQQRTDGWPTALWLVSLALSGRADPQAFVQTFDGSNASIADYLVDDVLSRQSGPVRRFLLHTSVLQTLSAPLCDAVLGRADSQSMLAEIERGHLFLVPQDQERRWWRYHPLFAGFLREQLRQSDPAEHERLCRQAARWWLAQASPTRAIEHLLQTDAPVELLPMLAEHAGSLLWQGRARTLARWYASVRPHFSAHPVADQSASGSRTLLDYPALVLVFAWALTLTHHYDESLRLIDALDARGRGRAPTEGNGPGLTGVAAADSRAVRAFMLAMSDQVKASAALWHQCVGDGQTTQPFARAMLGASYGFCLLAESRFDEAWRFLEQARAPIATIDESFIPPMASCLEGAIELAQGRRLNAVARFRAALSGPGSTLSTPASSRTVAAAFLAEALYEGGELDEAERLLLLYLPMLVEVAAPDQLMIAHRVLARIAFARGDDASAAEWLAQMELLGHRARLPRMVASARLERARIALARGDPVGAQDQLAAGSDDAVWQPFDGLVTQANDSEAPFIAALRLKVRTGRADAAIAPLRDALRFAQSQQRHRRALKLNVLLAEALWVTGQGAAGSRRLHDALRFAAAEGFVRCFVDEGETVLRCIAEMRASLMATAQTPALMPFVERLLSERAATSSAPDVIPPPATPTPARSAPGNGLLSDRELQVLQLLAGGHRNRAIADQLFVSETTVKAHLRNINTKLGADSRTHAVALARQKGLIG